MSDSWGIPILACAASILGSCIPAFETPENARISCRESADCPPGLRCSVALERCVATDDDVPPGLALRTSVPARPMSAVPHLVAPGDLVHFVVSVDEELGDIPTVFMERLDGSSERPPSIQLAAMS